MKNLTQSTKDCLNKLEVILKSMDSMVLAFSGGVDSSLLLEICNRLSIHVKTVSIKSEFLSNDEMENISSIINNYETEHIWREVSMLQNKIISSNPELRCYHCKHIIFSQIKEIANSHSISNIIEGTHSGDMADYRPGIKAIEELGITSPLKDAGFHKNNIRELAEFYNLQNWNRPSLPCMATRIPYNSEITLKKLHIIDESEAYMRSLGFHELRVRHHGNLARIELNSADIPRVLDPSMRKEIDKKLKIFGFTFVTIDLMQYKSGSMNREIRNKK